jgi:hypothetical protein
VKAWKNIHQSVQLSESGGHDARLPHRRVFPFNFLLKHYPVRSQAHGERKVFRDRAPRWDPQERAGGWHIQYDHVDAGHNFVREKASLLEFDETFDSRYLMERLTHAARKRCAPQLEA